MSRVCLPLCTPHHYLFTTQLAFWISYTHIWYSLYVTFLLWLFSFRFVLWHLVLRIRPATAVTVFTLTNTSGSLFCWYLHSLRRFFTLSVFACSLLFTCYTLTWTQHVLSALFTLTLYSLKCLSFHASFDRIAVYVRHWLVACLLRKMTVLPAKPMAPHFLSFTLHFCSSYYARHLEFMWKFIRWMTHELPVAWTFYWKSTTVVVPLWIGYYICLAMKSIAVSLSIAICYCFILLLQQLSLYFVATVNKLFIL